MVQFVAVSQERHGSKKWQRHVNYRFAATEALAPIVGAELSKAPLSMPLAFSEQAGRYTLVGVLSLTPGRNMFVGPDGRWLGDYIPAFFRGYPFRLLRQEGSETSVLCIDQDSKLLMEADGTGEDFFDNEGKPSTAVKSALDFLGKIEANLTATDVAVSALANAGVISKWEIKVRDPNGERSIDGLYQINESALGALSDEDFIGLRKAGALALAYCQLLSMRQIQVFERLAAIHAQFAQATPKVPDSLDDLFHMADGDLIKFN